MYENPGGPRLPSSADAHGSSTRKKLTWQKAFLKKMSPQGFFWSKKLLL